MKTVELKQVNIENYKKFEAAEYQFAPRTMVSGRNRQGKTTLMDAYFDTLTGKLADGTSPNNVRRKEDGEEVEGVVSRELTLLIDGEETVIRKETKKGKSSSTTKYQVDGFDYNQTKYKEFLKGISDSERHMRQLELDGLIATAHPNTPRAFRLVGYEYQKVEEV